jgi:hypothetical protein
MHVAFGTNYVMWNTIFVLEKKKSNIYSQRTYKCNVLVEYIFDGLVRTAYNS